MNKFILDIKLLPKFGLEIEIIYFDERFLYDYDNPNNKLLDYETMDFHLYSLSSGSIYYHNVLVLPNRRNYHHNYKLSYEFDSDEKRYDYLKSMYVCLNAWGRMCNEHFKESEPIYNENIIMNNSFWIL